MIVTLEMENKAENDKREAYQRALEQSQSNRVRVPMNLGQVTNLPQVS